MAKTAAGGSGDSRGFYKAVKERRHSYDANNVVKLLAQVDEARVTSLAETIMKYVTTNLPTSIEARSGLAEYRTNPYVLMSSASVTRLTDPNRFASFLFNNKLYMGLETSFGKSIESVLVKPYPIGADESHRWQDPPEKIIESKALAGLSREAKAQQRVDSVWREIDRSCVIGTRRYMTSIKSGPNCINDTQVKGMTDAVKEQYRRWMEQTKSTYPAVTDLDIVIGITYGTDKTTNNKENQILVKLLQLGFEEEDRATKPGVLIDSATRHIRIYRRIGLDFWSFIGNPVNPDSSQFSFLEVLLGLSKALSKGTVVASLEERVNAKITLLSQALQRMTFPKHGLPAWFQDDFTDHELVWLAAAMSAFFDEGI